MPLPEAPVALLALTALLEHRRRLPLSVRGARPAGVVLGLVGVGVAAVATRAAAEVDLSRPDDLVRSGPYRCSRHPMYVGWAFVYAGTVLGARSTWGVLLAPALAALLDLEARAEERRLLTRFPDAYADYRSRVPRFLGLRRP